MFEKLRAQRWGILVCVLSMAAFVPAAQAAAVTFNCSGVIQCGGSATQAGSDYDDTAGINVFNNQSIPGLGPGAFTLTFNTAAGTIGIATGLGPLPGTFSGFTKISVLTTTTLILSSVICNVLPPQIQGFLGSSTGIDSTFRNSDNAITDISITITTAPEAASVFFVLLASGWLVLSMWRHRRHGHDQAK